MSAALFVHALPVQLLIERPARAREQAGEFDELLYQGILRHPPPGVRRNGRNREWSHLYNADVISMPNKREYLWCAAWDLAFHCVPLALADSEFAKQQLTLMLRDGICTPMDSSRLPRRRRLQRRRQPPDGMDRTGGQTDPVLMGMAMGLMAMGIIYSPWGKQSGAHLNPSGRPSLPWQQPAGR